MYRPLASPLPQYPGAFSVQHPALAIGRAYLKGGWGFMHEKPRVLHTIPQRDKALPLSELLADRFWQLRLLRSLGIPCALSDLGLAVPALAT